MLQPRARESWCASLIYPVPDPQFPFLGVHFTRTSHGGVEAGPNAVLAFAREGYTLRRRVRPADVVEHARATAASGAMARQVLAHGRYEVYRSLSKAAFVRALQRLVPDLRARTSCRGGAGRAGAGGRRRTARWSTTSASPAPSGAVHVLNAPSPAATASLAIGRHVAALAADTFRLPA